MQLEDVRTVAVIGAGQMGRGIAHVFAAAGLSVSLCDVDLERASAGRRLLVEGLEQRVRSGKFERAQADALTSAIVPSELEAGAASADLVIEAATEELETKLALFRRLDGAAPKHALLCSNTSSISITRLAAATRRPEQVEGMHFMNPVPVMKLVELIRGLLTSDATHTLLTALATRLGKTTVTSRDRPGFIVNRILIPMLNEACFALSDGVAGVLDIDQAISLGLNHPMGPLRLADWIGLDTVLSIAGVLHQEFGDDKYRPAVLLRNLVAAGQLGVKSGRGFYHYEGTRPTGPAV